MSILSGLVTLSLLLFPLNSTPQMNTDFPQEQFVKIYEATSAAHYTGSGTYIGNGFILTAGHVADPGAKFQIKTSMGVTLKAEFYSRDAKYDVGLLKLSDADAKLFTAVPMDCSINPVGQHLKLMGNPYDLEFVYTRGEVIGIDRPMFDWADIIPVDATLVWGQSGGAALNDDGKIAGINVGVMIVGNSTYVPIAYVVPAHVICDELKTLGIDIP